ncbi:MAG: DUF6980 family protein [Limisphaerales bacterium]
MPPARKEVCDCGTLEQCSKEPGHPIQWDERMNDYHIMHGKAYMMVYFCPFCGGSAPPSRRASFFAHVTREEELRIYDLFKGIRTVADVLARFGAPDHEREFGSGNRTPEKEGKPEGGECFRTLVYKGLSSSADISFAIGLNDCVKGSWIQKYIGESKK